MLPNEQQAKKLNLENNVDNLKTTMKLNVL
jgi:hypothetical protein